MTKVGSYTCTICRRTYRFSTNMPMFFEDWWLKMKKFLDELEQALTWLMLGLMLGLMICTGLYLWVSSTAGYDHQVIKVGDVEWICLERADRIVSCETVDYF